MSRLERQTAAHVSEAEYAARRWLDSSIGKLPIFRREVVNPGNLQLIKDKLAGGVGVILLATHPGMKETVDLYGLLFNDLDLATYKIAMGVATHQRGRIIEYLANRTGVTFRYITTPETIRQYDRRQKKLLTRLKNRLKKQLLRTQQTPPQLYEGLRALTQTSEDFLTRGAIVGLFPQGTRSPQLQSDDDMKALSLLATIVRKKHEIKFAVAFVGIDMVGLKSKTDYEKHKGMRSFIKRYRYTFGPPIMIDDALADPDVNGDYRKLDYLVQRELSKLVGEPYRGDFSSQG